MTDATRGATSEATDDGFVRVAAVSELEPGVPLGVEHAALGRLCVGLVEGTVVAFTDQCSHREFPLSAGEILEDGTVECPWHGARFDCRTGAVLRGPACDAVKVHEVRVEDGIVYVRDEGSGKREEVNATLSREEV